MSLDLCWSIPSLFCFLQSPVREFQQLSFIKIIIVRITQSSHSSNMSNDPGAAGQFVEKDEFQDEYQTSKAGFGGKEGG